MKQKLTLLLFLLLSSVNILLAQRSSSHSGSHSSGYHSSYHSGSSHSYSHSGSHSSTAHTGSHRSSHYTGSSHSSSSSTHHRSNYNSSVPRDSHGRIKRSSSARYDFMKQTGYPKGRPGYVIDHIKPLKEGGCDCPANMQWQTKEDAKAKDKWE